MTRGKVMKREKARNFGFHTCVMSMGLNPETRRSGGMHYTSIENIHKVVDHLFLDDLKKEIEEIKEIKVARTRENKLSEYQDKLSRLKFFRNPLNNYDTRGVWLTTSQTA